MCCVWCLSWSICLCLPCVSLSSCILQDLDHFRVLSDQMSRDNERSSLGPTHHVCHLCHVKGTYVYTHPLSMGKCTYIRTYVCCMLVISSSGASIIVNAVSLCKGVWLWVCHTIYSFSITSGFETECDLSGDHEAVQTPAAS